MGELLPPEVLEILSTLLLQLQAACDSLPFPDFQQEVLRLVQAKIPFDSALWAVGALGVQQEPVIFSIHLFNQPQEMLASYEHVKHADTAFMQAFSQFGTTVNISLADVAWGPDSEGMKAHAERYGMRHTLSTITRGPISELIAAIVLYRANPANAFTERERLLQQNLVPHLVMLHNRSHMQNLEALLHPVLERRRRAVALVDSRGMLYNATPSFLRLMLVEWPEWHGPQLPSAMLDAFVDHSERHVALSAIVLDVTPVNDLYLLHGRDIDVCDSLSKREWDVAVAFGNGLSHKEIAKTLGIAPGTVRNHLSTIYEKLGVSNKATLVHTLKRSPR